MNFFRYKAEVNDEKNYYYHDTPTLYRLVSLNTRLLSSTRAELWNLPDAQNDHKSRPRSDYVVRL